MLYFRKFSVLRHILGTYLVTTWSIDRFTLHELHTGAGSLVMRKKWVRCVWPILAQVIMTLSLRFKLQGKFNFFVKSLMFLNLFGRGSWFGFSAMYLEF